MNMDRFLFALNLVFGVANLIAFAGPSHDAVSLVIGLFNLCVVYAMWPDVRDAA